MLFCVEHDDGNLYPYDTTSESDRTEWLDEGNRYADVVACYKAEVFTNMIGFTAIGKRVTTEFVTGAMESAEAYSRSSK